MRNKTFFITFILILIAASCVKDNFDFDRFSDRISFRPAFVIPLANGSLTLGNLLENDDSLVFHDPDNSIRIAIRQDSVYSVSVSDIIEVPLPESVNRSFTMGPIGIDDFESSSSITLGEMTEPGRMQDPEASQIRASDGSTVIFPPVPSQYLGDFPVEPIADIDYVYFTGGEIAMRLTNGLPVGVNIHISIINQTDRSEVATFIFDNLGPSVTDSRTAQLAGRMVTRDLIAEILDFNSPGSDDTPVYLDLEDAIEVEVTSSNLFVDRGRAVVNNTVLDSGSDNRGMDFAPDQQIDELALESGLISYSIPNHIGGLELDITLGNVTIDGNPFTFNIKTDGSGGDLPGTIDLSNGIFDFSEYENQVVLNYIFSVGNESGMTEFDLTYNELNFSLGFSDFVPGYVKGYFGSEEFNFDDEEFDLDFDFFDKITGEFWFENPAIRLFYENSIGVPVKIHFNLDGESSGGTSGNVMLLEPLHDMYDGLIIASPETMDSPAIKDTIIIDRQGSNIREFISLPPSRINLTGSATINPEGPGVPNFITSQSSMNLGVEVELPLEIRFSDLIFTDSVLIDIDPGDLDMFESLILTLDVTNRFPLDVALSLHLFDSLQDRILESFEDFRLMRAAEIDGNGIVIPGGEVSGSDEVEITGVTVDNLKQATHLIVSARLNTGRYQGVRIPVKLQTTSGLDFRIRLKTGLHINN